MNSKVSPFAEKDIRESEAVYERIDEGTGKYFVQQVSQEMEEWLTSYGMHPVKYSGLHI